jgi:hypothetical protein
MEPETVQIKIPSIIAAKLQARAEAQGITLDELLREVAEGTNGEHKLNSRPFYETASPEEWVKKFNEWAASHDPNTPALTIDDVSRDSIYD